MKNEEFEAKIRAACEADGIDVDFASGGAIDMWSPKGKVFHASGCHTCVAAYGEMSGTYTEALRSIWRDYQHGLEDCDQGPDCDRCNEIEEENK